MKKTIHKTVKPSEFTYRIPAIRATQAGQEYFTTAIPFGVLAKLLGDASGMTPVDRDRPKAIAQFIASNPATYVLPALTISMSGEYVFTPLESITAAVSTGTLTLDIDAEFEIHDGTYRVLGIAQAILDHPALNDESVSVVIFPNSRSKSRKFADIRGHQRKSGRSERIVSDRTDAIANITREVIANVSAFTDSIEMGKTTISNRSKNLFTFSALYQANEALLSSQRDQPIETRREHAIEFWNTVQDAMPDWTSETPRVDLRKQTVHAHGVTLSAIAVAGALIVERFPKSWKRKLGKLSQINWLRDNHKLWEGKAMLGGRMTKTAASVELTAQAILTQLGL